MHGFPRLLRSLPLLWPTLAQGQTLDQAQLTPTQAIAHQQEQVRETVNSPACRPATLEDVDTIYVCGDEIDQSTGIRSFYMPPRNPYVAPEDGGAWFRFEAGPVSLSCCSVQGQRGSAAGLGLSVRF